MLIENIVFGEQDAFLRTREVTAPFDKPNSSKQIIVPDKFKQDVKALTEYVGEANFKSGLCIEVTLSELLDIVPRQRRRRDAYTTLVKYLSGEWNINLIIK